MTDLPSTWALAPLENLISHDGVFTDGDWVESKDQDPNGSVRLIQLADIADNRFVNKSSRFLSLDKAYELNCTFLKKGDILVARMPDPLGRSCLFPLQGDQSFVTVVDVCVIRLGSAAIEPRYLMRAINSPTVRRQISDLQSGSTRKRISRGNLATVPIPIAPTNEQRRIVERIEAMFDEIDKGVESLHTAKTALGLYRQSLLKSAFEGRLTADWRAQNAEKLEAPETLLARIQSEREARHKAALDAWQDALTAWHASGEKGKKPSKPRKARDHAPLAKDQIEELPTLPAEWTWVELGQLTWSVKDGPHYSPKYSEEGIPFISGGNIRPSGIDFKTAKFISPDLHEELSLRCKPEFGDVLYTKGGTTGIARVNTYGFDFNVWVHVAVLKITETTLPFYLQNALNSPFCHSQAQKLTHGVGNQDLGLTRMVNIRLPICSPAEQAEIGRLLDARFEAADALEAEIDAGLSRANALRQSILQKAFSGRLVPQDPNDEPASNLLDRIKVEKTERERTAKRDRKSGARRKPISRRPILTDLIEILEKQKNWISAAKAAEALGVSDGASSDAVETFYRQLKEQIDGGAVSVERRGDEDWLRLANAEAS